MLPLIPIIAIGAAAAFGARKLIKSQKTSTSVSLNSLKKWLLSIGITSDQIQTITSNALDNDGCPLLIRAIRDYQPEIAEHLLKNGADPDVRDNTKTPALCYAAKYALDNNILSAFNKAKADFNAMDSQGRNAIFYAQNSKTLNQLVQYGTIIDTADCAGETPIFFVRHAQMLDAFIKNGANINHQNNDGKSPIFFVHNSALLSYFIEKGANPQAIDNAGRTALFYAESLNEAIVLMYHGVNPIQMDAEQQTADIFTHPQDPKYQLDFNKVDIKHIHDFIRQDNRKALSLLKRANAIVPLCEMCKTLPFFALENGSNDTAVDFLQALVPVLSDEKEKRNPRRKLDFDLDSLLNSSHDAIEINCSTTELVIQAANKKDSPEICQFLMHYVSRKRIATYDGCIKNNTPRIFAWLLKSCNAASDIDALKELLSTIIETSDKPEFIYLLINEGLSPNCTIPAYKSSNTTKIPALMKAIQFNKTKITKALLESGADLDKDMHAVRHAFETRNLEMVDALLKAGADPNDTDQDGVTLVEAAIKAGEAAIARSLIEAGAEINHSGCSILVRAIKGNLPVDFIEYLIKAGAKLDEVDAVYGMTPLLAAKASTDSSSLTKVLMMALQAQTQKDS